MTTTETNPIDEARLEAFVGQAVADMGAAISGLLLHIGDRLGLYKAMAGAGPVTLGHAGAPAPAPPSGTSASGSATRPPAATSTYDPADGTYELPAEQAMVVAERGQPGLPRRRLRDHRVLLRRPRRVRRTRSAPARASAGTSTTTGCSPACCGSSGPATPPTWSSAWLPALDGVVDKLQSGASVADVGCGLGASTIIMAQAFERSTFVGFDIHEAVDRRRAQGRGARRA